MYQFSTKLVKSQAKKKKHSKNLVLRKKIWTVVLQTCKVSLRYLLLWHSSKAKLPYPMVYSGKNKTKQKTLPHTSCSQNS